MTKILKRKIGNLKKEVQEFHEVKVVILGFSLQLVRSSSFVAKFKMSAILGCYFDC